MEVVHMNLAWVPPSTMNPLLLLHCKVLRRLHLLVVAYFGVPQVCVPVMSLVSASDDEPNLDRRTRTRTRTRTCTRTRTRTR
jgi:hypothetical protein